MREPAYEPSPQVKPVVHSLFEAKESFGAGRCSPRGGWRRGCRRGTRGWSWSVSEVAAPVATRPPRPGQPKAGGAAQGRGENPAAR